MKRAAFACLLAVVAVSRLTQAQTWRTLEVSRPVRDTGAFAVHVAYGAGNVRVQPATDRSLYDLRLRYDAERSEPVYSFDATARTLNVGVRRSSIGKHMGGEGSELQLLLSKQVPLRLQLDVGAAEGEYDLSGLSVESLSLQTGATDTRMRFDEPNPLRMSAATFQVGAASVQVTGLGNANVQRLELNLGVGAAMLDFGGEWRGDVDMTVNSALGKVTLRVPPDVGVRVESSTFLHSLDAPGMTKRDGYSVSSNWDRAKYKLSVRSTGAFGQLEIQRSTR